MADIYRRAIGDDNMAWCNGSPYRILAVEGPDAFGINEDFIDTDVAANVMPGWTCTLVNASTVTLGTTSGGHVIFTSAGAEEDGVNAQVDATAFEMTTDQSLTYFGIKFQLSEATQSDFLVGLAVTDTSALAAVADATYFQCLDGVLNVDFVTENTNSETTEATVGVVADGVDVTLEFYWDGAKVYALFNGAVVATHISTDNLSNDTALTPTIAFLDGAGAAITMTVDWVRAFQVGR